MIIILQTFMPNLIILYGICIYWAISCHKKTHFVPYQDIIVFKSEYRCSAVKPILRIAIPYPENVRKDVPFKLCKQVRNLVANER